MASWQGKSQRKKTGGRRIYARKKRSREIGREKQYAQIGDQRLKFYVTRGRNQKVRILAAKEANIMDRRIKKTVRAKILSVLENPTNPHYVRRNIITKGAIVDTEIGIARITSRPGQHGMINAVLIRGKADKGEKVKSVAGS
jgi:small subunit ribosomal protein S8e